MAKKKKKDDGGGGGAPAWMATFSDLMNLLLCFFVLLFASSTVDAEKYEMIVASLQSSFSILPSGGSAIIDTGELVGMGISQLSQMDVMYSAMLNSSGESSEKEDGEDKYKELYEEQAMAESEKMAEAIENALQQSGVQDMVEVEFNGQYVVLTLNGALLFDSGAAEVKTDAYPILDKVGSILETYTENVIEIEGHTDNVPYSKGGKYESNEVLSTFRALYVAQYLRNKFSIRPEYLKYSGRGEYVPIADNSTAEGRARNRRVEIKIYNTLSSGS